MNEMEQIFQEIPKEKFLMIGYINNVQIFKTFFGCLKNIENEVMIIVHFVKPGVYSMEIQNNKNNWVIYSIKLSTQVFENFYIDPSVCDQNLNYVFHLELPRINQCIKQLQDKNNMVIYIE